MTTKQIDICRKSGMLIYWTFLILLLVSCNKQLASLSEEAPNQDAKNSISYLALGDSYTIGEGVNEQDRWPNQLIAELEKNGYIIDRARIVARTGWTTENLIDALENTQLDSFHLVSLLIGVNNQYQGQPFKKFEDEFAILLNKSISLAQSIDFVFVVSIPDYGVTPFGRTNRTQIGWELDQYNSYMKQVCSNLDIPFIDITEISRELGSSMGSLASDQLHPSGLQYGEWVKAILPHVLDLIQAM